MSSIVMDGYRYCPPTAADFPTIVGTNSENPTVSDTTGRGLNILFGTNPASGSDNVRGCFKTLNAASNQTIIARFDFFQFGWNYTVAGLAFTDGTKFLTWGQAWRGTAGVCLDQWTNKTSYDTTPLETQSNSGTSGQVGGDYTGKSSLGDMDWMRVDLVSGSPTKFYISSNGTDWTMLYDSGFSGFITPTEVGFFMGCNMNGGNEAVSGTQTMYLNVLYYSDPDITPPV